MQLPSIQLVWHGKGTSASRRAYAERLATASRGPTRRHIAIDEALLPPSQVSSLPLLNLPISPTSPRLLPPSPTFLRLLPPSSTCSRLLPPPPLTSSPTALPSQWPPELWKAFPDGVESLRHLRLVTPLPVDARLFGVCNVHALLHIASPTPALPNIASSTPALPTRPDCDEPNSALSARVISRDLVDLRLKCDVFVHMCVSVWCCVSCWLLPFWYRSVDGGR